MINPDFVKSTHTLYDRYRRDWRLQMDSFLGGTEYRLGRYLRAYSSDVTSPSETINTYDTQPDGSIVARYPAKLLKNTSKSNSDLLDDGTFYSEKLQNTPLLNYVRLIVSEYNSILFRNPPQRDLPPNDIIWDFISDVDGEGNNISEFQAQLDQYVTIYGVCHVGVYLFDGQPRWRIHSPLDVTNWRYSYTSQGELRLQEVVIQLNSTRDYTCYRYMTPDAIHTVWTTSEDSDWLPEPQPDMEQWDDTTWAVSTPNELGYVPLVTTYQNIRVYDNVGSTIIADCAGIQRSIHADLAEIYTAITYGTHPTLVLDEATDQLNNGEVGAEPGSKILVPRSISGGSEYTYQFVSPDLAALDQIQSLIDSKIDRMAQTAMLRSETLIRAANSGEQLDAYDDKLAALIRRKATNLENSEHRQWQITLDWLGVNSDISITYSRQYNRRALEHEIAELRQIHELITSMGITDDDIQDQLLNRIRDLINSTDTQNGV